MAGNIKQVVERIRNKIPFNKGISRMPVNSLPGFVGDMQNFEYVNEIVSAFNKGRNIAFNLELTSEKKTVPANAYLWQLCHKIGTKIGGLTKEDVYKDAIKAKGVFQYIKVDNFEEFNARWSKLGTGWFCEEVSVDNYVNAYYGSSTYNKKELANVIDFVVEVAKEQGICRD